MGKRQNGDLWVCMDCYDIYERAGMCPECNKEVRAFRGTFTSPYTQYSDRIGEEFIFTGLVKSYRTHPNEMDEEVGPLFRIRFVDGTEIDAYPEEVVDGWEVPVLNIAFTPHL